jgi:hypothetical protein
VQLSAERKLKAELRHTETDWSLKKYISRRTVESALTEGTVCEEITARSIACYKLAAET